MTPSDFHATLPFIAACFGLVGAAGLVIGANLNRIQNWLDR